MLPAGHHPGRGDADSERSSPIATSPTPKALRRTARPPIRTVPIEYTFASSCGPLQTAGRAAHILGVVTGPLVSVVVPTRNECPNVAPLAERIRLALAGVDHEICFVDDSDDGTPEAIAALGDGARCLHRDGE